MAEFLNVGARVGSDPDCPNSPNDVQAVQRLIALILRGTPGTKLGVPIPDGRFDAITGYHIFNIQNFVKKSKSGTTVDGVISPAPRVSYGGGIYSILYLNAIAHKKDPANWAKILDRFRPPA
jgi:hypothetical protein